MEDYKKILAISGRTGLFKLVGQMKNGIVAESLEDGKRFPVYVSENISSLEDISIYTEEGEKPLREIFKSIHTHEKGKKISVDLSKNEDLKKYFSAVVPNYDVDKVYPSDIKKALKWYNSLLEKKLLLLDPEKKEKGEKDSEAKPAAGKKAAADKATTPVVGKTIKAKPTAKSASKKAEVKKAPAAPKKIVSIKSK